MFSDHVVEIRPGQNRNVSGRESVAARHPELRGKIDLLIFRLPLRCCPATNGPTVDRGVPADCVIFFSVLKEPERPIDVIASVSHGYSRLRMKTRFDALGGTNARIERNEILKRWPSDKISLPTS